MGEFVTDKHLGGYIKGGDPETYNPLLWEWVIKSMSVKFMLDIGCGEGHALKFFRDRGCKVMGIDGMPQPDGDIILHDFTTGPVNIPLCDLAWSCEFLEHVKERYIPNIMSVFTAPIVMITHAFPGQGGYHHVNCQLPDYWKGVFATRSYTCDQKLTDLTRELAIGHYKRSGLVFRKIC